MVVYRKSLCLYIYIGVEKKEPKLKLVKIVGYEAENRSAWVELTKLNSNEGNVDTDLIVQLGINM